MHNNFAPKPIGCFYVSYSMKPLPEDGSTFFVRQRPKDLPHLHSLTPTIPNSNASTPFPTSQVLVRPHMKTNCTGYEYRNRNWVLRLFCDRATVCIVPLSSLEFSGRRTYFRDRSYTLVSNCDLLLLTWLTKKRAFAKKVYANTIHPTHPPVPLPPLNISLTTKVTITPTNL